MRHICQRVITAMIEAGLVVLALTTCSHAEGTVASLCAAECSTTYPCGQAHKYNSLPAACAYLDNPAGTEPRKDEFETDAAFHDRLDEYRTRLAGLKTITITFVPHLGTYSHDLKAFPLEVNVCDNATSPIAHKTLGDGNTSYSGSAGPIVGSNYWKLSEPAAHLTLTGPSPLLAPTSPIVTVYASVPDANEGRLLRQNEGRLQCRIEAVYAGKSEHAVRQNGHGFSADISYSLYTLDIRTFRLVCEGKEWPIVAQADDAKAAAPAEAESFRKRLMVNCGHGIVMNMALIPAGKFIMGSPSNESGRDKSEGPQHEVVIESPFYMSVTEVTQEQYQEIMGKNPAETRDPQLPVTHVNWETAWKFCSKLSQRTGRPVRLPTEAQWEYACRAGSQTTYSFGDSAGLLGDYAWYDGAVHPVAQKKPNAWGLCDMHGNIWEWCDAVWTDSYATDTSTEGFFHIIRGGSWDNNPERCRSAVRNRRSEVPFGFEEVGFRVIMIPK